MESLVLGWCLCESEYIDGTNLENVLSEAGGVLSEEKVIFYALQIAEALQYLHSLNPPIINRDIKSRNIMVDGFDNVKLVDFDIAMEYNPNIDDICILGTKGYTLNSLEYLEIMRGWQRNIFRIWLVYTDKNFQLNVKLEYNYYWQD